jgi:hypothetical protein
MAYAKVPLGVPTAFIMSHDASISVFLFLLQQLPRLLMDKSSSIFASGGKNPPRDRLIR